MEQQTGFAILVLKHKDMWLDSRGIKGFWATDPLKGVSGPFFFLLVDRKGLVLSVLLIKGQLSLTIFAIYYMKPISNEFEIGSHNKSAFLHQNYFPRKIMFSL
jgi:hypothetical protein